MRDYRKMTSNDKTAFHQCNTFVWELHNEKNNNKEEKDSSDVEDIVPDELRLKNIFTNILIMD